jgi:signal transduction histidine kinase
LEKVQGDLRDLSAKLLQLQDEERRRIARDLHDSAGQTLTVLGMNLGQLEQLAQSGNGQFTEKLQEVQELLQRVTQEIRTTSYLLHPPLLDESGIAAALRWYVDGLNQRTPLKIDLSISEDFGRFPRETELAMFRIVRESLSNVLRHSGSDVAKIRIRRLDNRVTLEVEDQGRGIAAEKLADINEGGSGVGVRGMRDRVRHLNGEMKLEALTRERQFPSHSRIADQSRTRLRKRLVYPLPCEADVARYRPSHIRQNRS